ncbi:DUF4354 family protein [Escherichia coli]|uniref:DUF4354 family protein n=1 Tax=Escherichia coli TaxID=562 RepID=UPI0019D22D30|nr:DUF4354 family protein [Escherichia coli]
MGEKNVYTKSFEVMLKTKRIKKFSLSGVCLKDLSPDGKEFTLIPADKGLSPPPPQSYQRIA